MFSKTFWGFTLLAIQFSWNVEAVVFGSMEDSVEEEDDVSTHMVPLGKTLTENCTRLSIYCCVGVKPSYFSIWRSVFVEIKRIPEEYSLFTGANTTEVIEQYRKHENSWFPILPWREKLVQLPAFGNYCIGISCPYPRKCTLQCVERKINFWKVLQLAIGILLFHFAPVLCRNAIFYYSSGVSLGIIASLLILVFLLSRLMPKKIGAYTVLLCGWSLVLYFFQLIWNNLQEMLKEYRQVVIAYIGLAALVSFVICYRFGPVSNARTLNLIQWGLQLVALFLIFFSSEIYEVTTAIILVILVIYNFPTSWSTKARTAWNRRFPPKVLLLTEAEYIQQGYVETKNGLMILRTYCLSPECNAWKQVCRLKDPVRFASFVLGQSHLSDEEVLDYETETFLPIEGEEITDDESPETTPTPGGLASRSR